MSPTRNQITMTALCRWLAGLLLVLLACSDAKLAQTNNHLVYQIFVRSFADTPADTARSSEGEAGDLKGILENLDYLNDGDPATDGDLEAGILWLMPILPSRSYHGYDITNYRAVNPEYGTLRDIKDLVRAAHRRGVRVILDIAFNHTSSEHPWFKQAVENPNSRFRRFYHFRSADEPAPPGAWHVATSSSGKQVRYFGLFSPAMPDLNLAEARVQQEVKAIARFWLDLGIDGFRLDASKHVFGDTFEDIPEQDILRNKDWWRDFSNSVYRRKPNAILVSEVLGSRETLRRHAYGNDALLDEPFLHEARSRIAFPAAGFLNGWNEFVKSCREVNRLAHLSPRAMSREEPFQPFVFLASHDASPRLASYLEEMKRRAMQASVDEAYRLGMYLLTSMSKYAVLYNGDELMQRGFKWNGNPPDGNPPGDGSGIYDETLREPFPWLKGGARTPQTGWFRPRFDEPNDGVSVEEANAPGTMLDLVRALTNLRVAHPAYANGELGSILTDSADWLVFEKVSREDRYLVLINSTANGNDYQFHDGWFPRYAGARLLFWSDGQRKEWKNETTANKHIESKVFVPPYGFVLLREKQ